VPRDWDWSFEDERAAKPPPPPPPAPPPPAASDAVAAADRSRYLRRRIGAAVVLAFVLGALIAAAAGSSGHRRPATVPSRPSASGLRPNGSRPPAEPEDHLQGAVAAVRAYTPFVREGSGHVPEVALTFDDGPGPYTPALLAVLEHHHVHATFFEVGRMERYFSASTVREVHDGDVIGDHTEDHPMMALLSAHDQYEQLFEQMARIELLDGPRPVLFRPPYGSYDAVTMRQLRHLHLLMVLWSADTADYQQPGVAAIVQRALAGAHPGAIILMHDGGGNREQTIAALPAIIRGLRARGLEPVTVPRLLRDDPPRPGQPLPPSMRGD
jgi:peptidoglycan/xylan/chitin deacetylase (PgdA/CDA1 family)